MGKTIAIAGKGGTGKTTVAALIIKLLAERGSVLAIDGDPATNLNLALGLPLSATVGQVREEMTVEVKSGRYDVAMPKPLYLEMKVNEALVEGDRIDLLAMGRPEGPGCYCAANNMLRVAIDKLARGYDYVVIDNEAGMEHISRQTTQDVDILLVISDPTIRGITTAVRMKDLIGEIRTRVGRIALVVNRVNGGLSPELERAIREGGLELLACLPLDPALAELETHQAKVADLPPDSPARCGVQKVAQGLGLL
ncbi:MAG: AAA family ATPase [Chloroflexi bacterium]|nr:AAA family ATPase [Chloroflexota bacterium]